MNYLTANIREDPNIGLYGWATEKYCLLGSSNSRADRKMRKTLKVNVLHSTAFTIELSGIFCVGNSFGIIAPSSLEEEEIRIMEKAADMLLIDTNMTALGNMIVMNDSGVLISPLIKKHKAEIKKHFGVPVEAATIGKSKIIGSSIIATNNGCLAHPKMTEKEEETIRKTLGVEPEIGTVSFGSPFVKAGLLANSRGFVASSQTSGHELGRISNALGFV